MRARLAAALISVVIACGPASAQPPSVEVLTVTDGVLARGGWLAESQHCPASLMTGRQSLAYLAGRDCLPGRMTSCLSRCASNDGGACYWLAESVQEAHGDERASEALFQRACRLGIVSGCTNRAAGIMKESSPDDSKVKACAARTFGVACQHDDPWACTMRAALLSRGLGVAQDREEALKVLLKSCKYGPDDPACEYARRLRAELEEGTKPMQQRR